MKTKLIFSVAALGIALFSTKAEAVVCTDPTSAGIQSKQYLLHIKNWAQEKSLMNIQRRFQAELSKLEVQNSQDLSANEIARTTQVATDIHNKQQESELAPVAQACDIVSSSESVSNARKGSQQQASEMAKKYIESRTASLTPSQIRAKQSKRASEIFSRSKSSGAYRADAFMGISSSTLNKEQMKSFDDFISVMSNELYQTEYPETPSAKSTQSEKARYAKHMRELTLNSLVHASLTGIKSDLSPVAKNSDGKMVSHVELVSDFVEGRFGGNEASEFISLVTNTHKNKNSDPSKYLTTQAQALRHLTTLQAASLYIDNMRYKQGIRLEMLEAVQTQLLAELNNKGG